MRLPMFPSIQTIAKHVRVSYARSSGAGGQHVNTTDSKAILKLSASEWYASRGKWIHETIFDSIMKNLNDSTCPGFKKFPYFTPSGDILIQSSNTRYRDKNLQDCYDKFSNALQICSKEKEETSVEKLQKWDNLSKRDNQTRLSDKKFKKDKKSTRKKMSLDY